MNTLRKQILVGLAALSMGAAAVGAAAQAQAPEGRHGHAATMEQRQAHMAEAFAKRQAKLHDEQSSRHRWPTGPTGQPGPP